MTFDDFIKEMVPLAGQVVLLYRSDIVMLQGVGRDESDYYYIVDYAARNKKRTWTTAVGHLESFKAYMPDETYKAMVKHFELQNVVPRRFEILSQTENGEEKRYTWDGEKRIHVGTRMLPPRPTTSWLDEGESVEHLF